MGRCNPGGVMSLMFLIPIDWSLLVSGLKFMFFGLFYVFGYVIMGASVIKIELNVPAIAIS